MNANPNENPDLDIDDEDMPYDKLMAMLGKPDDDAGEDIAFGAGEDTLPAGDDTITAGQGLDMLDDAAAERRAAAKVDPEEKPAEADPPAPEAEAQGEAERETQPPAEPAKPDDLDALLDGIPDERRTAIRDRVTAADDLLAVFKGHEAELERHGVKPADAVARLVELNAYATRNPSDYLAWAATQLGGKPEEVLGKAAERLGLKLVPAQGGEDDDPFEDPEVKAMRQELAALKAQQQAPALGPDSPQARTQNDLAALAARSPHWKTVEHEVAALASAHVQRAGTPATIADVERFYRAAVTAAGLDVPPNPAPQTTPAAQPAAPVPQEAPKAAAPDERLERARAASKSLDGSGQGAGRRPALDPNASIEQVLTSLYKG